MRFVIVTGMSGAGKSTALNYLEDSDYYCVDNLPAQLLLPFAQIAGDGAASEFTKFAVGIDIRSILQKAGPGADEEVSHSILLRDGTGRKLSEFTDDSPVAALGSGLTAAIRQMDHSGIKYEILFLDASDEVLLKRYKETRRTHPLSGRSGSVEEGIAREREKLAQLRAHADYIIDTSKLLTRELKSEIMRIFVEDQTYRNLYITVQSFGFKYGIPADSDLVIDVRFLPNPYYEEKLRPLTGNDQEIVDFVTGFPQSGTFLDKYVDLLHFLIPNYVAEGKNQLVISVGCTGGRHRSVALANELVRRLSGSREYGVRCEHRDIDKDPVRKGQ